MANLFNCGGVRAPQGPVITSVKVTAPFQRFLERHRRRPGRPAAAAHKAERILSELASGNELCPWEAGTLTRFGDARIPGCVKFELGGGYRLICQRRGGVLVALFLGNHEECHIWLRANTGLAAVAGAIDAAPTMAGNLEVQEDKQTPESLPSTERAFTDRELRTVFAGLCGV
jgi:hypothetical protein